VVGQVPQKSNVRLLTVVDFMARDAEINGALRLAAVPSSKSSLDQCCAKLAKFASACRDRSLVE